MTAPPRRPTRRQAAIIFAVVGLLAGSAHVLANDASSVRLWREILPLAGIACAAFGWLLRPRGYFLGAIAATSALIGFTLAYAVAETVMAAGRGEIEDLIEWQTSILHWADVVFSQAALAWHAGLLAGGLAGMWLGRRARL
jgi:hypothetical protein